MRTLSTHSQAGFEIVEEADADQHWDECLRQMPRRTIFHSSAWLNAINATFPGARIVKSVATQDGHVAAMWPALEMRKGPYRLIGSPLPGWSTPYMGPLFASECDICAALETLLSLPRFRKSSYFACRTLDDPVEIPEATTEFPHPQVDLVGLGFSITGHLDTFLLDLSDSEEALWSNLKSQCRSKIQKARRSGVEIREERDGSFIDDYWSMSLETFSKSGIRPTYSRRFCLGVFEQLSASHQIVVLSGFVDGRRAATLILPHDDRTMYYWAGAGLQQFRQIPIHNLLVWEAICRARSMSLGWFDMVTTGGGPGEFKKSFGPRRMLVGAKWERSASPIISAAKSAYQYVVRLRRRL
jgi:hypothetical protein